MKKVLAVVAVILLLPLVVVWFMGMRDVPPYVAGKRTPPAAVPGVQTVEHRLDSSGVKLLRTSLRPEPSAPVRGTLVIVHGLKDYSDRYRDFGVFLVKRGFRVETFDLRGHGDSEGARVQVDSFNQYLDDLDKVMAEVRADPDTGPIFLFGHSMGGAIATRYTETRDPKLAGLILSAAALKVDVPGPAVAIVNVLGAISPRAPIFGIDDANFSRVPGMAAMMAKDPLIYDPPGPAKSLVELLAAIEAVRADAKKVTVPLLALHGSADVVTPPEGDKELVAAVSSTDKTAKLYPNLVHDLVHEPEAQTVMEDIAVWMETRTVAAVKPTPPPEPTPGPPMPPPPT